MYPFDPCWPEKYRQWIEIFQFFLSFHLARVLNNNLLEWTSFLEERQLLERVSAENISQSLLLQIRNVKSSICKHPFLKAFALSHLSARIFHFRTSKIRAYYRKRNKRIY